MGLEYQFVTALYSASHQALPCHTVDIWHPLVNLPGTDDGLWIIFIHGGAWRDPSITSQFAHTAASKLCRSGGQAGIAGIASINYRLSPSDRHPAKANDPCRQAKHPDHLVDVVAAIHYLQGRFHFGDRYIMIGHSCGAALAFQTLQWQARNPSPGFSEPRAIVGVAGIYDFPLLRSLDPKPPTVQNFLTAAFGPEEQIWLEQSPVNSDYEEIWSSGMAVILARCADDEYVSPQQQVRMNESLATWASSRSERVLKMVMLDGGHDNPWVHGKGLVECVEATLACLASLEK